MTKNKQKKWTIQRRMEFKRLSSLLQNISMLNKSTGILTSLENCIATSEILLEENTGKLELSFITFLRNLIEEEAEDENPE